MFEPWCAAEWQAPWPLVSTVRTVKQGGPGRPGTRRTLCCWKQHSHAQPSSGNLGETCRASSKLQDGDGRVSTHIRHGPGLGRDALPSSLSLETGSTGQRRKPGTEVKRHGRCPEAGMGYEGRNPGLTSPSADPPRPPGLRLEFSGVQLLVGSPVRSQMENYLGFVASFHQTGSTSQPTGSSVFQKLVQSPWG